MTEKATAVIAESLNLSVFRWRAWVAFRRFRAALPWASAARPEPFGEVRGGRRRRLSEQNRRPARSQARRDRYRLPPPPARALQRAGRSFYSAAVTGGAQMTPAQIAEAQRLAREWKPTTPSQRSA
jgi:hypothetical protein